MAYSVTSSVYMDASMNGHLEKKGLMGKKTKYWCYVQGPILYQENVKEKVVTPLDVSESHQIRKVQSDATGTQFEIVLPKKKFCFISGSSEDCSQWVKALQHARMCKQSTSTFFVPPEEAIYSSINEIDMTSDPPLRGGEGRPVPPERHVSTQLSSDYEMPQDVVPTFPTDQEDRENIYSDVEELRQGSQTETARVSLDGAVRKNPFLEADRRKTGGGSPGGSGGSAGGRGGSPGGSGGSPGERVKRPMVAPPSVPSSQSSASPNVAGKSSHPKRLQTKLGNVGSSRASDTSQQIYDDGMSGQIYNDGSSGQIYNDGSSGQIYYDGSSGEIYTDGSSDQVYNDGSSDVKDVDEISKLKAGNVKPGQAVNGRGADDAGYSTVNKVKGQLQGAGKDGSGEDTAEEEDDDDSPSGIDLLMTLDHALSDFEPVSEVFHHRLSDEDRQPAAILQAFLSNNRDLCRSSFVTCGPQEDAIGNLKSYLSYMQNSSLKHLFTNS